MRLEDSSLSFNDSARGISLQLTGLGGRLQLAGQRLALEVRASVSDEQRNRVLGDLGATVLLQLDDERRPESAEWHLDTGEVMNKHDDATERYFNDLLEHSYDTIFHFNYIF